MAIISRRQIADLLPVAKDGLIVKEEWLGIIEPEVQQAAFGALFLNAQNSVASDEVPIGGFGLVGFDGEAKARIDYMVFI